MLRRVLGFAAFAAAVVGLHWAYGHVLTDMRPVNTDMLIRVLRTNVDSFTRLSQRTPSSLDEACARLTPAEYGYLKHCGYWLQHDDTVPLDGWRHPLRYSVFGAVFEIRSAGPDGRFGTKDDIVYNSVDEHRRAAAAAGCYRIDGGEEGFPTVFVRLDLSLSTYLGEYPASSIPPFDNYGSPRWRPSPYAGGADSIEITWRTTDDGSVVIHLPIAPNDTLVGRAEGRYRNPHVVAVRIPCQVQ